MSDNIDRAIGQIKDMLSTEEGQREIENILSSVQGEEPEHHLPARSNRSNSSSLFNLDSIMRLRSVMDNIQMDSDPRVNLLTALRPYLTSTRGKHIDNAIKIMSLGKLPYALKNMKR